jgi:hypothetical protein
METACQNFLSAPKHEALRFSSVAKNVSLDAIGNRVWTRRWKAGWISTTCLEDRAPKPGGEGMAG